MLTHTICQGRHGIDVTGDSCFNRDSGRTNQPMVVLIGAEAQQEHLRVEAVIIEASFVEKNYKKNDFAPRRST